MEAILERINSVAGVTGSLVCGAEGQVLASAFPASAAEESLSIIGRTAAQTMAGLQKLKRTRVQQIEITYDSGRFIIQNLQAGYLCVLCHPQTNIPLLTLTAAAAVARLPELISQRAAAPAARVAPGAPDALDALSGFVETLVEEIGSRGIGREQLLAILAHRLERLKAARPLLGTVVTDRGSVDLTAMRSSPNAEMAEAVALVITALCQTCTGMLGQEVTRAAYRRVYEPFQRQNEGLLRTLGLDRILDKAVMFEGGPLPGIELQL